MKIESVDFFYLSMPDVLDIGDGSQDTALVRIRAGGLEGWGECEAAPLPTIASYVCPMSHSGCKPVRYSVENMELNSVSDIYAVTNRVKEHSFDLLQADHTLSGIDIALWDLLGKHLEEPVYKLLGYKNNYPKLPYASSLFGDTPAQTYEIALKARGGGYKAVKFGWGPIGKGSAKEDIDHFHAAREGFGQENYLMVDIGTAWKEDVDAAKERVEALKDVNVYWLEEPFSNMALKPYKQLSVGNVPLAAGEGCNDYMQAWAMMEYGGLRYIQIDTGRIGGITTAKRVADEAVSMGIKYVNHTFTSHLALSASTQPFAGLKEDFISEYPFDPKELALNLTTNKILPDGNGEIKVPDAPGLGIEINKEVVNTYLVETEIHIKNQLIYKTPKV